MTEVDVSNDWWTTNVGMDPTRFKLGNPRNEQIRSKLTAIGLDTVGIKAVILARLTAWLENPANQPNPPLGNPAPDPANNSMQASIVGRTGFRSSDQVAHLVLGAKWATHISDTAAMILLLRQLLLITNMCMLVVYNT